MSNEFKTIAMKIENSPFKNVYWFARYLMDTDQYGGIGRAKEIALLNEVGFIESIVTNSQLNDDEKFNISKESLLNEISNMANPNSKIYQKYKNLVGRLNEEIKNLNDIVIFCIAMKCIVAPINQTLTTIPSNDYEFSSRAAKTILDTYGQQKAGLVINVWDNLGIRGCLNAERAAVVESFTKLINDISNLQIQHDDIDDNIMMTAFVQEFERRAGQKRKARGGHSLESVLNFLFDYYRLKSSDKPSHFDQDIEVDKWFKCKDGWSIGISCKRTLRERWKQLSQADRGTLSHFKIKEIWHLITFDSDLSDDKIVRLGEQSHVFYLLDESPIYQRCIAHQGMKLYVRSLSNLIEDIVKLSK